jgi:hypothetical protein
LYEYFLAFEWVPEKMISVSYDKLLAILSPPSSMRRFSNLNTFILVPAITEIREKTHFSGITMIPCKQGRNITKIDFVYNFSKPKLTLVPPLVDPSAIPHGLPLVGTSVIPHGIPLVDPSAIPHGLPLVGTSAIPHRLPLVGTSAIPHELPLVGTSAIPHGLPLVDPSAIPHGKPLANPLVIPHGIPLVNPLTKSDELSLEKIVERYTTILEGWNKVEVVDGLKDDYYIFIKKNPKASDISFWNEYFECVKNKNFVNGKTFRNKNLPWLLRYQNYCDILNNKYTNTTITNKEYNPHQNLIDSLEGKAVYWPEKNRRYILADGIDDDFNLTKVLKSDILDEYGKQYQIDLSSAKRGLADKRLVIEELN